MVSMCGVRRCTRACICLSRPGLGPVGPSCCAAGLPMLFCEGNSLTCTLCVPCRTGRIGCSLVCLRPRRRAIGLLCLLCRFFEGQAYGGQTSRRRKGNCRLPAIVLGINARAPGAWEPPSSACHMFVIFIKFSMTCTGVRVTVVPHGGRAMT